LPAAIFPQRKINFAEVLMLMHLLDALSLVVRDPRQR